ncbi:carbonic anhydrase 1-like [Drosophila kikkawai]|uniref:Carbonic anhydrase n=1 Tax=Drosophila kikkawai TaxID=30033 RepID=A0A6P4JLT1_DROKI
MHFCTFLLIACCFWTLSRAAHWSYPSEENSFLKWGGLCDKGSRQSPINLSLREARNVSGGRLQLRNYYEPQRTLIMVNNGHTISLSGFDQGLTLSGGFLKNPYVLEQLHLHWGSEHTLNGIRYPLEGHFVHRNTLYPNLKTAMNYKDGIAVIGVLYHESSEKNYAFDSIIRNLGDVQPYKMLDQPVPLVGSLLLAFLIPSMSNYYTYAGSLTTPSCAESVTWIVPTETYPVKLGQVNMFRQIEYEKEKKLSNNYRELQSKGDRDVLLVSRASGPARLTVPVFLILPFVLANWKFRSS